MPKLIERILYIHTYIIFSTPPRPRRVYIPTTGWKEYTPVNNIILYILLWRTRLYTHTHTHTHTYHARGDLCVYIYIYRMYVCMYVCVNNNRRFHDEDDLLIHMACIVGIYIYTYIRYGKGRHRYCLISVCNRQLLFSGMDGNIVDRGGCIYSFICNTHVLDGCYLRAAISDSTQTDILYLAEFP